MWDDVREPRRPGLSVVGAHAPIIAALITRRRELGWSLDELSNRIGCERALLGRWEHGDKTPNARNLSEWAQALGCVVAVAPIRLDAPA
jgi:transcriptional regulator with XRE-family HTH domain